MSARAESFHRHALVFGGMARVEVGATLRANQMNQAIKVLTVLHTATIPLTVITSAFGMGVGFPGFNAPEGSSPRRRGSYWCPRSYSRTGCGPRAGFGFR